MTVTIYKELPMVGSWQIAPHVTWGFTARPNWRTRMMARIFLGWKWTDA